MASNTIIKRPEWLTDECIAMYRAALQKCNNPYTEEEVKKLPFDGQRDMYRYNAYVAKRILTKYGLL